MLKQFGAIIWMGLSTIPKRRGPALVVVVGMACAVGALISILSLSSGLMKTIQQGRADRAIVLSRDSDYEFASSIPRASAVLIADTAGVRADSDGKPIVSADTLTYAPVLKKSDGVNAFVTIRGMGPKGLVLRPEIKLISGRMFSPGKHELIVGRSAAAQFQGLAEGGHITLPDGNWIITGTFASGGNTSESELLTDASGLLASMHVNAFKSETVLLNTSDGFTGFRNAINANPQLQMDVFRETDFLARQFESLRTLLITVGWVVGGIMGLGAMLGALNTMYDAVSARTVEIATLRALGFGGGAVMASVLVEAVLLAGIGALIGAALAWVAFDGNLHAMGGLVISLSVTPILVASGLLFACLLGLIGGLFPALRAIRMPVVDALRAT